ncbi:MAG TPA: FtsX-like permease family protein [Paenibacillus sp.]|uniref:ABC transporter permease n=1 Tax=Paenibacillus sp. TaxID=58172 RepID=UPI0028D3530A|nr:FtsX-like permease family protein [Paenibacillus sp.]HUC92821.1 FtsX-like permease family protein [Paenibacillus sp.]
MKWRDRFRFVRQNMAKNKSRLFLTVLATAMGCTFLIMLASVAYGLQKSMIDQITNGQSLTRIEMYDRKIGDEYQPIGRADAARFRELEHIQTVTGLFRLNDASVTDKDGNPSPIQATLVDFADEREAGMELSAGRMPENPDEIVVGYHFSLVLQGASGAGESGNSGNSGSPGESAATETLIGSPLVVKSKEIEYPADGEEARMLGEREQTFTIVGVLKAPSREYMQDTGVLIDIANYADLMPNLAKLEPEAPLHTVYVYADNASNVGKISKQLRAEGYRLYSAADSIKEMDLIFAVMKIGLVFVGTIAVLIASIGIYNTMTMAVTERAQDIGIMKAIGAHPRTIRSVFLIESAGIGVLGALIGVAAAYFMSAAVNAFVPSLLSGVLDADAPEDFTFSYIPAVLTIVSVAISLAVAVLSGLRPAARATRIDVLRALRRDL